MAGGTGATAQPTQQTADAQYAPSYQGPNVYDQSAGAYNNALGTAGMATQAAGQIGGAVNAQQIGGISGPEFQQIGSFSGPEFQQISAQQLGGVSAPTMSNVSAGELGAGGSLTPQQVQAMMISGTFNPQVHAQQIGGPQNITAGQLSNTDLAPYMNPFQSAVIDQSMSDLERSRLVSRGSDAAAASAAGAFGGSRHGVLDAETNRAYDDNTARTVAGLNAANFGQAREGAQFDIGNRMQEQQLNVQNRFQTDQANQAATLQADLATLQAKMRAAEADQNTDLQASLANQAADLQSQITALEDSTRRGTANQQAGLQAGLANQAADLQAQLAAMNANVSLAQGNQQTGLQAGIANQNAGLQSGLAGMDANLRASLANQSAGLQSGLAGMDANLRASTANQGADLQAQALQQQGFNSQASQLANLAGMQGNLANLGFGFGQQANQGLQQAGAQQQALQQALLDQLMGQYGGFTGSPVNSLAAMSQALGATPQPGQTTSRQPGLFDYLTMGAGFMGAMCWVAREVYGAANPAWLEFREWMMNSAPAWLRNAYMKHGPKWAEWVKRNPWSKRVLRPLMDMARKSHKKELAHV